MNVTSDIENCWEK